VPAVEPPPAEAATAPPPVPGIPPDLAALEHYQLVKEIGRGGMGVVYLARNTTLDRLEVLKVMNTAGLDRPGAVERFRREIKTAARLSHPNVVHAYASLQVGHYLVFAMEYVDGEDLAKTVRAGGPLPVAHAAYYVHQAARGLQHAFEKGMVHRDIKPSNLMLAKSRKKHTVKVLDFGLAKANMEGEARSDLTGMGKMLGTPDFVAPEQTRDAANADIRADLYSLGCTLYFLLAGKPPFVGRGMYEVLEAHQFHTARPLNLVRPEVPADLAAVVAKMMAKDPARRYQTPAEVIAALAPFIRPGASAPSDTSTEQRPLSDATPPRGGAETVPSGSTNPDPAVVPRPVPSKVLPVATLIRPPAPPPDEAKSAFEATKTVPPLPPPRPARPWSFYAVWGLWAYGLVTTALTAATGFALLAPAEAAAAVPGAGLRFAAASVFTAGLLAVLVSLCRDPADGLRLRWRDWRTWAGPLLAAAAYGVAASDYLGFRAGLDTWRWVVSLLIALGLGAVLPMLPRLMPARAANP
jgi:serine/threonine protein kinase